MESNSSSSSSSNRRSKSHKESSKKEKKSSKEHHSHHSQQQQLQGSTSHHHHHHHKKHATPRFGNLIPRNDGLKNLATSVLGDFHSTVETIRQEQHGLMGVDRSLPITPLPSGANINPFDMLVNQRYAQQQATPLPSSSLVKSSNFTRPDERRGRPHPLKESESDSVKHSKKRKKEKRHESSPRNVITEHAQTDLPSKSFPPKPSNFDGNRPITSIAMTSSSSHVTSLSEGSAHHHKPNRLLIDTSSLDSTDLQSIKDLINLPPFITPIHTPHNTNNPFIFPSSSTNTTTTINTAQNTFISSTMHNDHINRSPSAPSTGPLVTMTTDIIGNISSSEDSSSDSEEEESSEEEEEENKPQLYSENTASMLENIRRDFQPSTLNTITPIKTSPPHLPHPLSLNDESANLSPAKFPSSLVPPPPSQQQAPPISSSTMDSDSEESDSEDSSSDSESDDEEMEQDSKISDSTKILESTRLSDFRISDSNTLPFDVNHDTLRQISRPFTYEPDDLSPVGGATKGHSTMGDLSQRSLVDKNDHIHCKGDGAGKKRRHSEKPYEDKRLCLSDVAAGEGKLRPVGGGVSFLVQIPLSKVPEMQQKSKPQATVGPYRISSDHKTTSTRGSTSEAPSSGSGNERRDGRRQEDTGPSSSYDYYRHGDQIKREREVWDNDELPSNNSNHETGTSTDYWRYGSSHSNSGSRNIDKKKLHSPQYYFDRAKTLKRAADALPPYKGAAKATHYMEAVTYFMRHGHAQEIETSNNGRPYKIYGDIINMVKYCSNLSNDCQPLLIVCLKCHAVLLWRMFLLKQGHLHHLQKELQEVFNTSSKISQKSPVPPGNFSPLPSPASVGSTASSCSGPSSFSSSEQPLTVSKNIGSKVMEYISLTNYAQQGIELWKQSESLASHHTHHDFFSSVNRKNGDISQYSPILQVADWIESSLQLITRNCL